MKALLITTDNYPLLGATAGIFNKLLHESFLERFDEIAVLTPKYDLREFDFERKKGVKIYRSNCVSFLPIKECLKGYRQINFRNFVEIIWSKFCNRLRNSRDKKELVILSEEIARDLKKSLKKINADDYDYIIPIFGNYAAIAAVMQFNPQKAKIVTYQVDPCSTNWTIKESAKNKLEEFEKEMYKKAAAIITMPVIYKDIQHLITDDIKDKFYPMELPLIVDPKVEKAESNNEKLKCVFSGAIYGGIRDPLYTLKLFEKLIESEDVELHLVGVTKEELPAEFRDSKIVCYGRVLADEAQKIMNSADVLVNIGNLMNNQLPSKIYDYISLGRPIVNICKNRDCPTLPYMEKYPLSLNLFEEYELLELQKEQLTQFLADSKGSRIEFAEVEKLFENATPKYCADFIYNLLVSLQDKEATDTIQE